MRCLHHCCTRVIQLVAYTKAFVDALSIRRSREKSPPVALVSKHLNCENSPASLEAIVMDKNKFRGYIVLDHLIQHPQVEGDFVSAVEAFFSPFSYLSSMAGRIWDIAIRYELSGPQVTSLCIAACQKNGQDIVNQMLQGIEKIVKNGDNLAAIAKDGDYMYQICEIFIQDYWYVSVFCFASFRSSSTLYFLFLSSFSPATSHIPPTAKRWVKKRQVPGNTDIRLLHALATRDRRSGARGMKTMALTPHVETEKNIATT